MLIEIYNGLTLTGVIASGRKWRNTDRLNRAGTFSFSMPLNDPKSDLIQGKRTAIGYLVVGGVRKFIGGGVIDERQVRVETGRNGFELSVGGDNQLRELTNRSVGFLTLDDGAGGGVATALADIMAFAPSGWSFDTVNGYNTTGVDVYGSFAGELVLDALIKVAEKFGQHFRLGADRKLVWLRATTPTSGVRAVQSLGPEADGDASVCLIRSFALIRKTFDLVTRVYPFGAGNGNARLTMLASTVAEPSGYTLDKTNNYLEKDAATAQYGLIERYVAFKDIRPISNTTPDVQSAADALYTAAKTYLDQNCVEQATYDLNVAGLNKIVYPGETIHVSYRDYKDGYKALDVDEDLVILETTTEISDADVRTVNCKVSNLAKWDGDDASLVSQQIGESRVFEAHDQLSASVDTLTYRDEMDNAKGASFRFWLGDEYASIQRAVMRFRIQPLRSTVKSVADSSTSTASGGGSTQSSTSGGGQTATGGSHLHNTEVINMAPNVTDIGWAESGGFVNPVSNGGPSANAIFQVGVNSSHDHAISSHAHNVEIPSHTHSITPNLTMQYGIFEESAGNTLALANLAIKLNGGADMNSSVADIGNGWYALDITDALTDAAFRPTQENNEIAITTSTAKTARIEAQITVRGVVQAVAYS